MLRNATEHQGARPTPHAPILRHMVSPLDGSVPSAVRPLKIESILRGGITAGGA